MIRTYLSIHGKYGWVCTGCDSESRYTYSTRKRAERLGRRHHCSQRQLPLRARILRAGRK